MFRNLHETIKALNADVKTVANCQKAKKLRKRLLAIGLPLAIVGYAGALVCFILFGTAGSKAFGENGFTARLMVPFFLAIPCALIGAIGTMIASLGFKIVITGYTANLIDETVGNNCPNCGETITPETQYCPKCGTHVRKECSKCHHINSHKNDYCEKCGNKLD
ncbi:MAG TPA: hypothetical protein DCY93_03395 [Firmicutes bacterium]|nr:hypothetical protein [Bacillota bacterium]